MEIADNQQIPSFNCNKDGHLEEVANMVNFL